MPRPILRGSNVTIPESPEPELDALTGRLHPNRMRCSGKLQAILARLLGGFRWTSPVIAELILLSDDVVLARHEGDIGANDFIASLTDLRRNLRGVVDAAEITEPEDRRRLARLFEANVSNHGADFDAFEILGVSRD